MSAENTDCSSKFDYIQHLRKCLSTPNDENESLENSVENILLELKR